MYKKGTYFHSEETRKKMSLARKGRKPSLGKKWTLEQKIRMGIPKKGKKRKFTKEWLNNLSKSHKGLLSGKKHPNWKGGVTSLSETIRKSSEYKLWRKSVFERDKFTCIWCGQKGGDLNADHIKPFALFPELRFAIDNGRTLCKNCHKKTDTYGFKIINYV